MAPRTGRPHSESPKNRGYRLRMSDEDFDKLEYCCEFLGFTKAEVIRQGIEEMYQKARKQKWNVATDQSTQRSKQLPTRGSLRPYLLTVGCDAILKCAAAFLTEQPVLRIYSTTAI